MRILMITDFYHPFLGGVEKHVRSLSAGLVERGHDVAVATLSRSDLPDFEVDQGVRVYRVRGSAQRLDGLFSSSDRPWAPPLPDPGLVRGLQQVVARERPDVVHGHDWMARSFLPLKSRNGARLVMSLHYYTQSCAKKSLMHDGGPCSGPRLLKCGACVRQHYGLVKGEATLGGNLVTAAIERRLVDMFLPVSRATALGNQLHLRNVPWRVVPNFIPDQTGESAEDFGDYLSQLPAEEYLLFVGDLRRDKGLHTILRAHAELPAGPPLVLIGKVWPETPQVFPPNVVVLKHWPNGAVMEAWRRATLALVPSIWPEPCATVVLEAMAGGKPVIATDIGGNSDMVVDGVTGILIPPESPAALRSAIEGLLADRKRIERMGDAGLRRAREFQSSAVIPRFERVYEEVVARAAPFIRHAEDLRLGDAEFSQVAGGESAE